MCSGASCISFHAVVVSVFSSVAIYSCNYCSLTVNVTDVDCITGRLDHLCQLYSHSYSQLNFFHVSASCLRF